MSTFEITSEIYSETDIETIDSSKGRSVSNFKFSFDGFPDVTANSVLVDDDGDLIPPRRKIDVLEIEHSRSTFLKLVGLQIWRGAFLLADFVISNKNEKFKQKHILELGSGVGLTGIVAGFYSTSVVCTDLDVGDILAVIKSNFKRNSKHIKCKNMFVIELDFMKHSKWSSELIEFIKRTDIILAADVIYDDDLTDAFILTIDKIFDIAEDKSLEFYIALEKRYVFTVVDMETCAPCYEYFLKNLQKIKQNKDLKIQSIPLDFEQYFDYDRSKELVLWKISR